jgi:hypothetical protein
LIRIKKPPSGAVFLWWEKYLTSKKEKAYSKKSSKKASIKLA